MKITFVLPFSGRRPGGGIKVVYEYANQLVELGHRVTIIHTAGLHLGVDKRDQFLINLTKFFLLGATKKYLPSQWFNLDERVRVRWVPCLDAFFLPDADVVVATAWGTAEWVSRYPFNKGKKYYLIQGYEDWAGNKERVLNTWRLPLKKIVISKWLESIAFSLDQPARYIPNGLDFSKFGVDVPPENRDPCRLLMLYHHLEFKGTKEGLKALRKVRDQFPGIKVTLFGVSPPAKDELPGWVAFEQMPSQKRIRQLYNEAAVFISPSWSEGWGLTPAEAMQCGCATVITDVHEYAIDGRTALLSTPKDIAAMADNISLLLQDNGYRIKLAYAATAEIAQYTWPRATASLVNYFQEPE